MRIFIKRLVLTVWLGMIWSVGYLVAPVLFETLDDRALAGLVAGHLFTAVAWVSLVAGPIMALLILATGERSRRRNLKLICVVLVMASMVSVHWVFTPMMELARLPDGTPGESFLMIHGASSLVYLLGSLLGLVLLWPRKMDLRVRKES